MYWCRLPDSNWPPDDYKSTALPNELSRRKTLVTQNKLQCITAAQYYTLLDARQGGFAAFFGWFGRFRVVVLSGFLLVFARCRYGSQRGGRRRCGGGDGGRVGRGFAARLGTDHVEGHALAVFASVDGDHVFHGDDDVARDAAEAGAEVDHVVVHLQARGRAEADVQDDLAILDELARHTGLRIDHGCQVGRVAIVGTPLVDGAQEVGFGGDFRHDDECYPDVLKKRSERVEFVLRSVAVLQYGEHRRRKIGSRSSLFGAS